MTYNEYLQTPEWQAKRSKRLQIDHFKCQKCGRPMDLQVHHLTYANIGHENVNTDLITLCKNCHQEIEDEKASYRERVISDYREAWRAARQLELQFRRDYEQRDYSKGGTLNLTNRDVIRDEWRKWLKEKHFDYCDVRVTTVIDYFRTLRVQMIIEMEDAGATPQDIMARGISTGMVYKYFGNRQKAKRIIQYGLEEMEEYS